MKNYDSEIWKDIPGHEGYQASSLGRVRSVDRVKVLTHWLSGKTFEKTLKGKILSPAPYCKTEHLSLPLGRGTNGIPVHQLILMTFIGPCPKGMEVLHKNGISTDNRLENLRYGTRTENILDVYNDNGRWRKLSESQVQSIKNRLAKGEKGSKLADEFGVSQTIISQIKLGKIFWWVESA